MAPPKTTGDGKPPITPSEKAANLGITLAQYNERSKIGKEMVKNARGKIKLNLKGKKVTKEVRASIFSSAWDDARKDIVAKYGIPKLKELKVNYTKPPPKKKLKKVKEVAEEKPKPKKKKKSTTGKKGTVKSK